MRQRPSWTVPKAIAPVPATWATAPEEPAPVAPVAVVEEPPIESAPKPRLSLVPPPPPESTERIELRDAVAKLQADIVALRDAHEAEKRALIEEARGAILRLATAIAERAVGAELAASPALVEAWTAEAVATLGGGTREGTAVHHDGRVIEVTPAARVATIAQALEEAA